MATLVRAQRPLNIVAGGITTGLPNSGTSKTRGTGHIHDPVKRHGKALTSSPDMYWTN